MGGAAVARKLVANRRDVLLVEAGGTSGRWHGICAPLDEIDFKQRSWIDGSGWPITRADLMPYYQEAASALNIPGSAYSTRNSYSRRCGNTSRI